MLIEQERKESDQRYHQGLIVFFGLLFISLLVAMVLTLIFNLTFDLSLALSFLICLSVFLYAATRPIKKSK